MMEEAAQILEIETFIPLLLQVSSYFILSLNHKLDFLKQVSNLNNHDNHILRNLAQLNLKWAA